MVVQESKIYTTFVARIRALKPDFDPTVLEYVDSDESLYISGPNTITHKNYLSAIGCKWVPGKKHWHYIRTERVEPLRAHVQPAPANAPESFISEMSGIAPDFPFNQVTYELIDGVLNLSGEPTRKYRAFLKILKFKWNPATLKWYR